MCTINLPETTTAAQNPLKAGKKEQKYFSIERFSISAKPPRFRRCPGFVRFSFWQDESVPYMQDGMEQWWNDNDRRNPIYWEKNPSF